MKTQYKIYILLLTIIFYKNSRAQISNLTPAPPSIANTSVAESETWTAFNNPAALANSKTIELGIGYENRYQLKELSTKSIQIAYPTKLVAIAASFSYFGYSLYHQMLAGVDLSRNFSNKFNLGIGFDYYKLYYNETNRYRGRLLIRLGTIIKLSPSLGIGFSCFNPFQAEIQTEYLTSRIPSVFSLGTEYLFTKELVWRSQIDKEISSSYRLATGFEYRMIELLKIKLGAYYNDRFIPCIGTAVLFEGFRLDFNCELHPTLGLNTMIQLRYAFTRRD